MYIYIYFAVFVTFFNVDFFYYFVSVQENKDKYRKIWNYVVPGIHYFFVVQLPGEDIKRLFNCTGQKTYRDKKKLTKKSSTRRCYEPLTFFLRFYFFLYRLCKKSVLKSSKREFSALLQSMLGNVVLCQWILKFQSYLIRYALRRKY